MDWQEDPEDALLGQGVVVEEDASADDEQGMFEHFRLVVDPGQEPVRIDKYMAGHLENTSRHRIQLAIKNGYVKVGEKTAKANLIIRPGDIIRFVMPYERRGFEILPEDIPLDIVYEDEDFLIVNKPAGMVVHPGHGHFTGTLVNALAFHLGLSQGPWRVTVLMGLAMVSAAMFIFLKWKKKDNIAMAPHILIAYISVSAIFEVLPVKIL